MKGTTGDGQSVAVVHAMLSDAIIGGVLAAGSAVSQLALEKDYGVGRTPLREAIRMLQAEGFIVGEPKKRVRIAELTGADAEELCCLRIQLETTAVRQTIPTLSSRDIAEMEGYMAQMGHYGRGRDWLALREPHRDFHAKFTGGAAPRRQALIRNLFDHAERYRGRRDRPVRGALGRTADESIVSSSTPRPTRMRIAPPTSSSTTTRTP